MSKDSDYVVLARKYRPKTFSDLIGQEAMVRTLGNAIDSNRIAHAFILTGIRGTGKTSTARIIARALNCIGADGKGESPVKEACGECEHCVAIVEDRHVDVIEMDAASKTGINDIREIIENAHYLPAMARYKVYIIDEVHMLSKSAFNALLKTLEEPPAHVKFIFATTEIRKIPITILSRCMRFDLARVSIEALVQHLTFVAKAENVEVDNGAQALIANAAEGSVRDALSLLDQAIAYNINSGEKSGDGYIVTAAHVESMLGLIGRERTFVLAGQVFSGKAADAIATLKDMYRSGADPVMVLQDFQEIVHFLTTLKIVPETADAAHIPENDRVKGKEMADKLSLPVLARAWQVLLKGAAEVKLVPNSLMAAEMLIIRLCYISDCPPPGELIKKLEKGEVRASSSASTAPSSSSVSHKEPAPADASAVADISVQNFEDLVELFAAKGEHFLHNWLKDVHLLKFNPVNSRLEFKLVHGVPADFPNKISEKLYEWTGVRWGVVVSSDSGGESLNTKQSREFEESKEELLQHSDIKKIIEIFPGAEITAIKKRSDKKLAEEVASTPISIKTGELT